MPARRRYPNWIAAPPEPRRLAPTLILVLVMAEALLISRGTYAGAVVLAVLALPIGLFAARRFWRGRS